MMSLSINEPCREVSLNIYEMCRVVSLGINEPCRLVSLIINESRIVMSLRQTRLIDRQQISDICTILQVFHVLFHKLVDFKPEKDFSKYDYTKHKHELRYSIT